MPLMGVFREDKLLKPPKLLWTPCADTPRGRVIFASCALPADERHFALRLGIATCEN
jgi:hypothetical protein